MKNPTTTLAFLLLLSQLSSTYACTCIPTTLKKSYFAPSTALVIRATPVVTFVAGSTRFYGLEVQTVFKGCFKDEYIAIQTATSSAACGVLLDIGTSYVMSLPTGPIPSLNLCSFLKKYDDLTQADVHFLNTRFVCCQGECRCVGTTLVNCFVAPCTVSTPPCSEAVRCVDNYCGGCNAEWFNGDGLPACHPPFVLQAAADAVAAP